jgi:hypothetical protein
MFSNIGPWDQCYKTFLHLVFMNVRNKLECLSSTDFSSLVQCLWVRPGAYPGVEYLKASLEKALALFTKI